jgi:hypothetical protein
MRRLLGVAIVALFAVTVASAGTLYTVRTGDRMLRTIDTDTLTIKNVGSLGVPFDFGGLAYDSRNGKMFMVTGFADRNLYTVNMNNGQASLVGSHGFNNMFGLAYDSSTDTLYGSLSTTGTGFYTLDRSNGSAKLVGNPGISLDGLAYDSKRDMIVGAYAGPGSLHQIDRSNGSQKLLYDGDFFNNCGFAYDSEKDLFWLIDWSGNLLQYDPNNGYAPKLVMSGLGSHDGLEFVPEPTSLLLMLAGVALLRRR